MPPPRAVLCPICNGKFFKHSLPHHMKACKEKHAAMLVECPHCSQQVPQLSLQAHIAKRHTPKAPSGPAFSPVKSPGASAAPAFSENDFGLPVDGGRIPCPVCGRKFAPDRVAKHAGICKKISRPRPTFDATTKRLGELADEAGVRPTRGTRKPTRPTRARSREPAGRSAAGAGVRGGGGGKSGNWRAKHQEFQAALKAARMVARGEDPRQANIPGYNSEPSDYVRCPHCSRTFSPQAAERHIPRCQHVVNKPRPPPSRGGPYMDASPPPPRVSTASGSGMRAVKSMRAGGPRAGFGVSQAAEMASSGRFGSPERSAWAGKRETIMRSMRATTAFAGRRRPLHDGGGVAEKRYPRVGSTSRRAIDSRPGFRETISTRPKTRSGTGRGGFGSSTERFSSFRPTQGGRIQMSNETSADNPLAYGYGRAPPPSSAYGSYDRFGGGRSYQAPKTSGGILHTNASSVGNPLASSAYMVMPH